DDGLQDGAVGEQGPAGALEGEDDGGVDGGEPGDEQEGAGEDASASAALGALGVAGGEFLGGQAGHVGDVAGHEGEGAGGGEGDEPGEGGDAEGQQERPGGGGFRGVHGSSALLTSAMRVSASSKASRQTLKMRCSASMTKVAGIVVGEMSWATDWAAIRAAASVKDG